MLYAGHRHWEKDKADLDFTYYLALQNIYLLNVSVYQQKY